MTFRVKVWDLPLRIFHWLLVVAVLAAFATGELGGSLQDWHGRIGTLVLGLLVFRLGWGVVGSHHARFASFFPSPGRVRAYLQGRWQGHGHNPLGALSVLALLAVLLALVGTGLFANDDIAFEGPLYGLIDKDLSDQLSYWHALIFNVLAALVLMHIAAIVFYLRVKQDNLVIPMLTGVKRVALPVAEAAGEGSWTRFFVVVVLSSAVVWIVAGGPLLHYLHPDPVAPPAAAQDW